MHTLDAKDGQVWFWQGHTLDAKDCAGVILARTHASGSEKEHVLAVFAAVSFRTVVNETNKHAIEGALSQGT